jgi:hypothetical protein
VEADIKTNDAKHVQIEAELSTLEHIICWRQRIGMKYISSHHWKMIADIGHVDTKYHNQISKIQRHPSADSKD